MSTLSEKDLLERLAARHQPPAWAFLRHVADGTGVNKLRTADAMLKNAGAGELTKADTKGDAVARRGARRG